MCGWYDDGLYTTLVALENIEFQTRLMLNSVIAEVGQHGHEERVTPFKFHSETQMEQRCQRIWDELATRSDGAKFSLIDIIKWDILLIDDQAVKPLSHHKSAQRLPVVSKSNVISNLLNPTNKKKKVFNLHTINATNEGYIKQAFKKLKKKTYDVIFLDYLLGEGLPQRNGREYGYDFLSQLNLYFNNHDESVGTKANESFYKKGPLGRFWIFPISSFPFAFTDKLRQLGMDGYADYWYLSGGGDPVCTPALFKYNFLNFVKQQIIKCFLDKASRYDMVMRFSHIQSEDLWQKRMLRFIERIELQENILEDDLKQGSLFAKTMLEYKNALPQELYELGNIKNLVSNLNTAGCNFYTYQSFLIKIEDISENKPKDVSKNKTQDVSIRAALAKKGALFYKAETKFIQQTSVARRNKGDFEFSREGLRWLPKEVKCLDKIVGLNLSHNLIEHLPEEVKHLKSLKELNLEDNRISFLPAWIYEEMPLLNKINLKANKNLPESLQKEWTVAELKNYFGGELIPNPTSKQKRLTMMCSNNDHEFWEALKYHLDALPSQFIYNPPSFAGDHLENMWEPILNATDICIACISAEFFPMFKDQLSMANKKNIPILGVYWRKCSEVIQEYSFMQVLELFPKFPIKGKGEIDYYLDDIIAKLKEL